MASFSYLSSFVSIKLLGNPRPVVLKVQPAKESTRRLIKTKLLGPTPRVPGSVGLGWGLRVYMSNKFPDDVDSAGPRTPFENYYLRSMADPSPGYICT